MMKLFSLVVFLVGASLGPPRLLAQAGDVPLALTNVTVVDVREGVALADMTVVISGDRITAVGTVEEAEVPAGAHIQAQPSGDDLEAARQEQKAFVEGDCETVASFYSDEATNYGCIFNSLFFNLFESRRTAMIFFPASNEGR